MTTPPLPVRVRLKFPSLLKHYAAGRMAAMALVEMSAAAPRLFFEPDGVDGHGFVRGFAHIVDGERSDAHGRQCLHFHTRAANHLGSRFYADGFIPFE